MTELIFTPASVLDLLLQIDELSEYDIGITETIDGNLQLQIGESIYELNGNDVDEIKVDESIVDTISDINEDAYADLGMDATEDYIDYSDDEYVESSVIGELAKSLLLGGMVRLSAKMLQS